MGSCIIFCAGGFDGLIEPVAQEDLILAADGGFAHVQALGLKPDVILGDFDSLGYIPQDAGVFPVEKDDTDSMLAVKRGLDMGYDRFVLYGGMDGPRPDHTIANYQTLQYLADRGAMGYLVGSSYIATVVKNGQLRFPFGAQGIVSIFCMGADARAVTLTGLKYPLTDGTLSAGFPLGVSNHFTGSEAGIRVAEGSLLVLYERKNGFPVQEV